MQFRRQNFTNISFFFACLFIYFFNISSSRVNMLFFINLSKLKKVNQLVHMT